MRQRPILLTLAVAAALAATSATGCKKSNTPPCKTNADCRSGQRCVPTRDAAGKTGPSQCVTGAECGTDADCVATDPRKQCRLDTHKCSFPPRFADDCSETRPCAF